MASGSLRIQPVAPGISMGEQGGPPVEVESVPAGGQIAILTGLGASTNVSARVGDRTLAWCAPDKPADTPALTR